MSPRVLVCVSFPGNAIKQSRLNCSTTQRGGGCVCVRALLLSTGVLEKSRRLGRRNYGFSSFAAGNPILFQQRENGQGRGVRVCARESGDGRRNPFFLKKRKDILISHSPRGQKRDQAAPISLLRNPSKTPGGGGESAKQEKVCSKTAPS
ncbi:UNVERIFIED_CONTAM: hypothetical protein K2H54_013463 [Gekko kuhli]